MSFTPTLADFGGIPDDAAQGAVNSAAIVAMFTASPAGSIGAGTWTFNETFIPSSAARLIGAGHGATTLTGSLTGVQRLLTFSGSVHIEVEGINFDIAQGSGIGTTGLHVQLYGNVSIRNCRAHGAYAFRVASCDYVTVSDCIVDGYQEHGIYINAASRALVRGCTIKPGVNAHGILFESSSNCTATENYITHPGFFGVGAHACNNVNVVNNHIIGNIREGINLENCLRGSIMGNTVSFAGGGSVDFGISLFGNGAACGQLTVVGNMVYQPGNSGIALIGNVSDCSVHENRIINPGMINTSNSTLAAVILNGTGCVKNTIAMNTMRNTTGYPGWNVLEQSPANFNFIGPNFGDPGSLGFTRTEGASTVRYGLNVV